MTRVEKVAINVAALSRSELAEFRIWFDAFVEDQWDAGIETDIRAGKLDALADVALADFSAGRTRPL